ncbi:chorismate synthase [Parvicella tangerina]|uniref:Chorismate synthase n=1 Tax=Parvicella tangerina TaxID=2829795 RepID=A0A916JKG6_9FLAO|nr:chorismate synthase [Parvicella tangerina]CAG5078265.1 Chorismate synthase [Parvicella tangerina]
MNTFGNIFRLTSFGESHGLSIGGVIDGCPAGFELDLGSIQHELDRRKPGQSKIVTQRKESDIVEFQSGIFEGKTTGAPIGFVIKNTNQRSKDYSHIKEQFRPSHADYTYTKKYGHRDYRGGGRSSARETAARVVAGAIAKQLLASKGIEIASFVKSVGPLELNLPPEQIDTTKIDQTIIRCPNLEIAQEMITFVDKVRKEGDSIGGTIQCLIKGCPVGLGQPVFGKLHAALGSAMLSINAVKGFEYGSGFSGTKMKGSDHNDMFEKRESGVTTKTNYSGGIQGGISNGQDIYFNVAFKPVATIMQDQQSIDQEGNETLVKGKGRHDPCVLPRAVPIVDAMAAMVILDYYLLNKTTMI